MKLSQGETVGVICRGLESSEQSNYRWRRDYGGLKLDQAKKHKDLERADVRIRDLTDELRELQATTRQRQARSSAPSSGFLVGASRYTSVPTAGPLCKHAGDRTTAGGGYMA